MSIAVVSQSTLESGIASAERLLGATRSSLPGHAAPSPYSKNIPKLIAEIEGHISSVEAGGSLSTDAFHQTEQTAHQVEFELQGLGNSWLRAFQPPVPGSKRLTGADGVNAPLNVFLVPGTSMQPVTNAIVGLRHLVDGAPVQDRPAAIAGARDAVGVLRSATSIVETKQHELQGELTRLYGVVPVSPATA